MQSGNGVDLIKDLGGEAHLFCAKKNLLRLGQMVSSG